MTGYLPLIIGMSLATYLPRLIPILFLTDRETNPIMTKFLKYIPYTSLTILIVRGILTSTPDMMIPSIAGIGASALVAYNKPNMVLSVAVGIGVAFIMISIL